MLTRQAAADLAQHRATNELLAALAGGASAHCVSIEFQ
jgi:hypothetical protein